MVSIPIIPLPKHCLIEAGTYVLTSKGEITFDDGGEFTADFLASLTGLHKGCNADIRIAFDDTIAEEEGYCLAIGPLGIRITGKKPIGLLYGAESLRQLLEPQIEATGFIEEVTLPFLYIEDAPHFSYRGFMLDVSRHFFPVAIIIRLLDYMVMLKLNRFHWHLSDSQGWRVEIEKYPKLTEAGSKREGTLVYGWLWGKKYVSDQVYEGYYTKDQIREVVAYAKARGIEVIPEIDLPGHVTAMLASYPELSCTGRQLKPETGAKREKDLICAGKESSYSIIFDIFDELIPLFPYNHIHIGGDEANKFYWKKCPQCQAKIKENNLKNEKELQGYLMNRISAHLKSRGCTVIGWNDGLTSITDPEMTCQYWFFGNKKEMVKQVNSGRKVIYSNILGYYLDYSYKVFGLKNSYECGGGEKEFDKAGQKNVIGVETALWCEAVYNQDRIDWQMFPRILAIAESAWTESEQRHYEDFLKRLFLFEKRLDVMGVHHAVQPCYLKKQKTSFLLSLLHMIAPGEHPAMKEYRKYNEVIGYNKTDGKPF